MQTLVKLLAKIPVLLKYSINSFVFISIFIVENVLTIFEFSIDNYILRKGFCQTKFMRLREKYYINNHSCFKLDYQLLIILKIRELKNKIKNNNIFKNNSTPTM